VCIQCDSAGTKEEEGEEVKPKEFQQSTWRNFRSVFGRAPYIHKYLSNKMRGDLLCSLITIKSAIAKE
jgi:hypothetical protein